MKNIQALAQDFSRLDSIEEFENMGFNDIPTHYYDYIRRQLPLTDDELAQDFGIKQKVFVVDENGNCNRFTNAEAGTTLTEPFVAVGLGVIGFGEGEGFSTLGATFDRPDAVIDSPSLRVQATVDNCNSLPDLATFSSAQAVGQRQAVLWWGTPTWRYIEKFFQAYRLVVNIGRRFEIFNESLLDIGMVVEAPEFFGASDSCVPTLPFVRATNDTMATKGIGTVFMLPNRGVSANEPGDAALFIPPLNVAATYGHPRIHGTPNRLYQLAQPLLYAPGMRLDMTFEPHEGLDCFPALQRGLTVNSPTVDETIGARIDTGSQDEDPIPNGVEVIVPGGAIAIGVVLKGFTLTPNALIEYANKFILPNTPGAAVLKANPYLNGIVESKGKDKAGVLGQIV